MTLHRLLLLALLLTLPSISAPRQERVEFPNGKSAITLKGALKGGEDVDYLLRIDQEQNVTISLRGGKSAPYFNVIEPGKDMALFIGSVSGDTFEGKLSAKGDHIIRVYQMRSAARRGTTAPYTLTIQKTNAR